MPVTAAGKTFREKRMSLDGKRFVDCLFDRCQLDYAGGLPPELSNCRFETCAFSFSGHAAYTLAFLGGLHRGGFEPVVEQTFQAIRDGAYRIVPVQDLDAKAAATAAADMHPLAMRIPRVIEVKKRPG